MSVAGQADELVGAGATGLPHQAPPAAHSHRVSYDGTAGARATIGRWLADRSTVPVTMRCEPGARPEAVLVIQQSGSDPVHLGPGQVLVLRGGRFLGCARTDFDAAFDPAPREMPIYDGGE